MKKKILTIVLLGIMILPFSVAAKDNYVSLSFDEVLTEEGIEHDFSNYKETDKQVPVYLFRGKGCGYCHNFLEFMNSIIPEYGQYFKVVSYEVWNNSANATLMKDIASFLDQNANGVPFIVIGDQVFLGYSTTYDESIKKAITDLYNSKDRYDVMKEYKKGTSESTTESISNFSIVLWNIGATLVIVSAATVIIILSVNKKFQAMNEQLTALKTKEVETKVEKKATSKKTTTSNKTKKQG